MLHWCKTRLLANTLSLLDPRSCAALAIIAFFRLSSPADAQIADPNSVRDVSGGVYVHDSGVVTEKLSLADRMQRLGEWGKSAEIYQEIIEGFLDRVIPVAGQKDPERYVGVVTEVQQRMAKWPPAGIQAYNARYDAQAAQMLVAASDRAALRVILNRYFATDSAREAGKRLIDLALESGDFLSAGWTAEQLLQFHPSLALDRHTLLYRAAIAFHLAGDESKAARWAGELKEKFPAAIGTLRGTDVILAEVIDADLKAPLPALAPQPAESWPMFGGSNQRNRVSSGNGRPGAKTYSLELHGFDAAGSPSPGGPDVRALFQRRQDAGQLLTVYPVVDRGEMFFQDGRRLYALHADNDGPLPGWAQTYPGDPRQRGGQFIIDAPGPTSASELTVTLTEDSVLAIMGQTDQTLLMQLGRSPQRIPQLVCLNRQTGKERWRGPKGIPPDRAQLQTAQPTGSPIVIGDNVFVTLRNSKGMQLNDSFVVCLELASGKFRWATYIASANASMTMDGELVLAPLSDTHLASTGDRLFVCTDLGAVAALDASNGQVLWLNLYPREAPENPLNNPMRWGQRRLPDRTSAFKPWTSNPAIVDHGRVLALPNDGKFLHIYDAGTGAILKRIDLAQLNETNRSGPTDTPDTLVGVVDGKIILAGSLSVYCIDINAYQPDRPMRDNLPAILWKKQFFEGNAIRGRSFVTTDAVYVSTQRNINCIRMKNGAVEMTYPAGDREWDEGEGPGNILVLGDRVIVAGDRAVVVYSDLNLAKARLDAAVAADPANPGPRLDYAEVMDTAGQSDLALTKLDEAIELLSKGSQSPDLRQRAFEDCLRFAARLTKDPDNVPLMRRSADIYSRAAKLAQTPAQQAVWRVQRAALADNMRDGATAVQFYQEILANDAVRACVVPAESSGLVLPAGQVAERAIDRLKRRYGATVYAPFERKAGEALAAAGTSANPASLVNVAEQFPNARCAPQALLQAVEAYEARSDARQALLVLRQLYFSYADFENRPAVLESMARNYLAMPGRVSSAIARLAQGARLGNPNLQRPLRLPDGKLITGITLSAAAEELRTFAARQAPGTMPDVGLPIPGTGRKVSGLRPFSEVTDAAISDVAAIVDCNDDVSRPDRIVLSKSDKATWVIEPAAPQPKMTLDATFGPARGCAWVGGALLLWSDARVSLHYPDTQTTAWQIDCASLPALELSVDPELDVIDLAGVADERERAIFANGRRLAIQPGAVRRFLRAPRAVPAPAPRAPHSTEIITQVCPNSDRIFVGTSTGRIFCIDPAKGNIIWQNRSTEDPIDRLVANDDFCAGKAANEATAMLLVIDNYSGRPIGRRSFNLANGQPLCNLALSVDGTLVFTLPDKLFIKDLFEPWKNEARRVESDSADGALNLAGTAPDQLQVVDGRIIVLADEGRFVRVHSLETGRLLRLPGEPGKPTIPLSFSTGAANWTVRLRVIGPRLYALSPLSVLSINLDKPADAWNLNLPVEPEAPRNFSSLTIARDFLCAFDELTTTRNTRRLYAFGRYPAEGSDGESGRLDYQQDLTHPAGILWIRPVNHGLAFLSGDGKLHFLKSN